VDAVFGADLGSLTDTVDETLPRLGVGGLEGIVVTLDPGPDDEMGAEPAGEFSLRTLSSGEDRPPRPNTGSRCSPVATQ